METNDQWLFKYNECRMTIRLTNWGNRIFEFFSSQKLSPGMFQRILAFKSNQIKQFLVPIKQSLQM